MKPTNNIKYIIDQIVIAYCQYEKFGDKTFGNNFEKYTAQLMQITGLDRDGALEYAVNFLAGESKIKGVA
ncbi:hypothetical protein [Rummeliibacillus sp. BSL5]